MIQGHPIEHEFVSDIYSFSVPPLERTDDSPQILSLKAVIDKLELQLRNAAANEAAMREFVSSLQQKLEGKEIQLSSLQRNLDSLSLENSDLNLSLVSTGSKIQHLHSTIDSLKSTLETTESELSALRSISAQLPELQSANATLQSIAAGNNELTEQCERLKSEIVESRIARQECDRQVEQLRDSLKKAMRIHKDKDDEIHTLKQTILDLRDEVSQMAQQFDGVREMVSARDREILTLRQEIAARDDRLERGKGSAAVELRMAQVQRMLEKSNALYAEMHEKATKADSRVHELEIRLHEAKANGAPFCKMLTSLGEFVLCENGRYFRGASRADVPRFVCTEAKSMAEKEVQVDVGVEGGKLAQNPYLRNLIVQYFRMEGRGRKQMVPVILGVLQVEEAEAQSIIAGENGRSRFPFFGT
jgi:DNA repair exonuclease SbcCD ATPase subunit